MKTPFYLTLLLVATAAVAAGAAPAAAVQVDTNVTNATGDLLDQADGTEATPTQADDEIPDDCDEQIDQDTYLCAASTNGDTATLKLYSLRNQPVTLTDAGGLMAGGEIYQQTDRLLPERTTTLVLPVTESDGFVGVSVATKNVLYGIPLEKPRPGFVPGSPSGNDSLIVGASTFFLFAVALPGTHWAIK